MMKFRNIFFCSFILLMGTSAIAQKASRVAYLDMDYILENMQQHQLALQQLEAKASVWRAEIIEKQKQLETLRESLKYENIILTKELIRDREEEIEYFQKELYELQQKRFGTQGDYEIQQHKLVKPIQDRVFNAVNVMAKAKRIDLVFDVSQTPLIYSNRVFDISEPVLKIVQRNERKDPKLSKKKKGEKKPDILKKTEDIVSLVKKKEPEEEDAKGEPKKETIIDRSKDLLSAIRGKDSTRAPLIPKNIDVKKKPKIIFNNPFKSKKTTPKPKKTRAVAKKPAPKRVVKKEPTPVVSKVEKKPVPKPVIKKEPTPAPPKVEKKPVPVKPKPVVKKPIPKPVIKKEPTPAPPKVEKKPVPRPKKSNNFFNAPPTPKPRRNQGPGAAQMLNARKAIPLENPNKPKKKAAVTNPVKNRQDSPSNKEEKTISRKTSVATKPKAKAPITPKKSTPPAAKKQVAPKEPDAKTPQEKTSLERAQEVLKYMKQIK